MKNYYTYLEKLNHSQSTIKRNVYNIGKLQEWCRSKRTKPENLTYKQFLNYMNHLKTTNKPETINRHIWAAKHYFTYLIAQGVRADNIAEDLKVRGERKRVFHNLLTGDELEDLFYSFETGKIWKNNFYYRATAKRNKVIVGLLVYQGLISNNLRSLILEHVDLRRGTIYIPSTRRNAQRTLTLKSWQIIELKEYIEEIRPILQDHIDTYDEKLFPLNTPQFNVILRPTLKKLKTYNQKVINNNHIRTSVIVNWLGQYNIRKVQQMAGHRFISSTESYKQDNLENLHEAINQFHPLN
ncbi:integrase/recombinase XerD [Aquimarina sp. MAR_2010_214]|uniref:tyrosine-type recombinase/integrase n=1 Tax=Aquimarina sp. MAR_2010_214 TaxID=1250026 RepID=UPI000C70D74A|nr:tyrosine-type recombinase/integrase [Aquimarina sp. MAR_2010_214]PKV49595.1 integrase/recombinase XerD [Aquimarina sp. MAR_2010_214]